MHYNNYFWAPLFIAALGGRTIVQAQTLAPTSSSYPSASPTASAYPSEAPTSSSYPSEAPSVSSFAPTASFYPSAAPSFGTNVLFGSNNTIDGDYSTISGGFGSEIRGDYATIGGGQSNACVEKATVCGGRFHQANATKSTILGGQSNSIPNISGEGVIGGGSENAMGKGVLPAEQSAIGGGQGNLNNGLGSVILGGKSHKIDDSIGQHIDTVLGGGDDNFAFHTTGATITGGSLNSAIEEYAVVAGGTDNGAGIKGTVSGGVDNLAVFKAVVSGGKENKVSGNSVVAGGYGNTMDVFSGTISGGRRNSIVSSSEATITGGSDNVIGIVIEKYADDSIILSGESNFVKEARGIAAGKSAVVTQKRSAVFGLTPNATDTRPSEFVVAGDAFTLKIDDCPDLTIDASNVNILRDSISRASRVAESIGIRGRGLVETDAIEALERQILSQTKRIEELQAMVDALTSN